MAVFPRWLAPAVLAAGLAGLSPTTAHAQSGDELVRVIVDVADVIMRGGQPYYRHGGYDRDDRLVVGRDRYGRPVYYRQAPYAGRYPVNYGNGYGYDRPEARRTKCNKHGKCKVEYYDPRYDRRNDRAYYRGDGRRYEQAHRRWHDRYGD